jgi:hypothetical protein
LSWIYLTYGQESVEERMVVGEGCIVGCGVRRGLARTGKITELILGGTSFILDRGCNGSYENCLDRAYENIPSFSYRLQHFV